MFGAVEDLKCRLETEAMEYYEKWDLVDTHGWLIPEGEEVETFLTDRAKEEEQEAAAVKILQMLKTTLDAVPAPMIERTEKLYRSIGHDICDKIAVRVIATVGFGFDPLDAVEFVQALNRSLAPLLSET